MFGLLQPRARPLARAPIVSAVLVAFASYAGAEDLKPFAVVGDEIPASLTGAPGDPERGREIVGNRQIGLCLLCHTGPFPQERFQGDLAPDLAGAGARANPKTRSRSLARHRAGFRLPGQDEEKADGGPRAVDIRNLAARS